MAGYQSVLLYDMTELEFVW